MIPTQLVEQLSTAVARWDGRAPSDDDTLEGARRRPSRYKLTFRWRCGDLVSALGVGLRASGFRRSSSG